MTLTKKMRICCAGSIPEGVGAAPTSTEELAVNEARRQQQSKLSGSYNPQDVDAEQQKLEQQHA